uniref:hypothetical protein n=2 Tax=Algoriphagus sp. TaxID=1872435 RepID=UPI004047FAC8
MSNAELRVKKDEGGKASIYCQQAFWSWLLSRFFLYEVQCTKYKVGIRVLIQMVLLKGHGTWYFACLRQSGSCFSALFSRFLVLGSCLP